MDFSSPQSSIILTLNKQLSDEWTPSSNHMWHKHCAVCGCRNVSCRHGWDLCSRVPAPLGSLCNTWYYDKELSVQEGDLTVTAPSDSSHSWSHQQYHFFLFSLLCRLWRYLSKVICFAVFVWVQGKWKLHTLFRETCLWTSWRLGKSIQWASLVENGAQTAQGDFGRQSNPSHCLTAPADLLKPFLTDVCPFTLQNI